MDVSFKLCLQLFLTLRVKGLLSTTNLFQFIVRESFVGLALVYGRHWAFPAHQGLCRLLFGGWLVRHVLIFLSFVAVTNRLRR